MPRSLRLQSDVLPDHPSGDAVSTESVGSSVPQHQPPCMLACLSGGQVSVPSVCGDGVVPVAPASSLFDAVLTTLPIFFFFAYSINFQVHAPWG